MFKIDSYLIIARYADIPDTHIFANNRDSAWRKFNRLYFGDLKPDPADYRVVHLGKVDLPEPIKEACITIMPPIITSSPMKQTKTTIEG